ncbi:MAG: hypothetical protein FWC89_04105 [Defluviitaleaceae bacterium]|nr:hypothetical protein [Defluviitaleaceae bacterium]
MRRRYVKGLVVFFLLVVVSIAFAVYQQREIDMQKDDIFMIMALFPQNTPDWTFYFVLKNDGTLVSSYGRSRRTWLRIQNLETGVGRHVNLYRRNFMKSVEESTTVVLDYQAFRNLAYLVEISIHEFPTEDPRITLGGWNAAFLYNEKSFEVDAKYAVHSDIIRPIFDEILQLSQLPSLKRHGWWLETWSETENPSSS